MKTTKRILSILIVAVMVCSMVPLGVFAEEGNNGGLVTYDTKTSTVDDTEDHKHEYPSMDEDGYVQMQKSSRWIDETKRTAEISFEIYGTGISEPIKSAMVIDTSGSMEFCTGDILPARTYYTCNWSKWTLLGGTQYCSDRNTQYDSNSGRCANDHKDWKKNTIKATCSICGKTYNTAPLRCENRNGAADKKYMYFLKQAAAQYVDVMFEDEVASKSQNEIALVTFASSAKTPHKLSDVTKKSEIQKTIAGLSGDGGTDYKVAFEAVDKVFTEAEKKEAYVIFFTDGEPDSTSKNGKTQAEALKKSGVTVYSVAMGVPEGAATKLLSEIATSPDHFYNVNDVNALKSVFESIARDIKKAGTEAKLVDTINTKYFEYAGGKIMIGTGDDMREATSDEVSIQGNVITWNIGDINPAPATRITIPVVLKPGYGPEGELAIENGYPTGILPTNDGDAYLTYKNFNDYDARQKVETPELGRPNKVVKAVYYPVNEDGKPLDANGNVIASQEAFEKSIFELGHEIYLVDLNATSATVTAPESVTLDKTTYTYYDGAQYSTPATDRVSTIAINQGQDIYVVYYGYKEVKVADVTVNYYYDEVKADNKLGEISLGEMEVGTAIADFESEIVKTYSAGLGLAKELPAGYQTEGVYDKDYTAFVVTGKSDDNVINVVFKKKTDIGYTVNYYYDEVGGELIKSDDLTGTLDAQMVYSQNQTGLKEGYNTQGEVSFAAGNTDGKITADESKNVVNVVFKKQSFTYTVNYYYGSTAGEKIKTETGTDFFGEKIPYETALAQVTDSPKTGFKTTGTADRPDATIQKTGNVVNVVFEAEGYTLTVKHVYENGTDVTEGPTDYSFGSSVSTAPKNQPNYVLKSWTIDPVDGLSLDANTKNYSGQMPAQNVTVTYTYELESYDFTVRYYYDSLGNTEVVSQVSGTAKFGSQIDYKTTLTALGVTNNDYEEIGVVSFGPNGDLTSDGTVTAESDKNIVNVVFQKKATYTYLVNHSYDGDIVSSVKSLHAGTAITASPVYVHDSKTYLLTGKTFTPDKAGAFDTDHNFAGTMPIGSVTVTYIYTLPGNDYKVEYKAKGPGAIEVKNKSEDNTYSVNDSFPVGTPEPAPGATFLGWFADDKGDPGDPIDEDDMLFTGTIGQNLDQFGEDKSVTYHAVFELIHDEDGDIELVHEYTLDGASEHTDSTRKNGHAHASAGIIDTATWRVPSYSGNDYTYVKTVIERTQKSESGKYSAEVEAMFHELADKTGMEYDDLIYYYENPDALAKAITEARESAGSLVGGASATLPADEDDDIIEGDDEDTDGSDDATDGSNDNTDGSDDNTDGSDDNTDGSDDNTDGSDDNTDGGSDNTESPDTLSMESENTTNQTSLSDYELDQLLAARDGFQAIREKIKSELNPETFEAVDFEYDFETYDYKVTISYNRVTEPGPGPGGESGGRDRDRDPDRGTSIPDTNPPLTSGNLADIPDAEVPLTNMPISIDDDEVPLAKLPKTGGNTRTAGTAGALLLGLAALLKISKKDDE